MLWVRVYDVIYYVCLLSLSSPFMFVFGDHHVTCHTRAYVVSGDVGYA